MSTRLFGIRHLEIRMSLDMSRDQGFALVGLLCRSLPVNCQLGDLVFDIVPSNTCSRHRFAVLRAGSCRAMVRWWFLTMLQPHRRSRLRHRPSTTCFRRVSDNVSRGPSCRYMSGNRQLGGLDGAAAIDLVFGIASSKTCSRHFFAALSSTSLPRRPFPDLFPVQFRGPSCRSLSMNRRLDVLDGASAVDLVFDIAYSMTCFRHCFAVLRASHR